MRLHGQKHYPADRLVLQRHIVIQRLTICLEKTKYGHVIQIHSVWTIYISKMVVVVVVALSSLARILGECSTTHPPPPFAPPPFFFCFFFEAEISSRMLIPLFMSESVHSGSENRDDCSRMFPDRLRVSLFPDRFPHYAWTEALSAHSDFFGSKVYA